MATPGEESARESDSMSISSPGLSLGSDLTSGTSKRSPSDVWKHFIKWKKWEKQGGRTFAKLECFVQEGSKVKILPSTQPWLEVD